MLKELITELLNQKKVISSGNISSLSTTGDVSDSEKSVEEALQNIIHGKRKNKLH